jgi:lipopolysaccharide transport system permease protein
VNDVPDLQVPAVIPVRVRPPSGWRALDLASLWEYRELIYFLAWRDIKVRYKQTVLGVGWAVAQPLAATLVFTVVFGRLADLPSEGVAYPVFTMAALLPWQLFSGAFTGAANSVVGNANLISKVYFPRLIVPIAAIAATLLDFVISLGLIALLMAWYQIAPTPNIVFLPFFVGIAIVTALAAGLWTAALNVRYRDVRYVLPYVLQIWLFLSPVAYSIELVPEGPWQTIYALNPLAGVIQGFRWALLGAQAPGTLMLVSGATSVVLLVGGLIFFRRAEDEFSDFI